VKSASAIIKITTLFVFGKCAYTTGMSFFVQPTPAPRPKTKNVQLVSLSLAAILTIMAVAQLFTFEKFPEAILSLGIVNDESIAALLAALVPVAEVAALPYLLFMPLSRPARVVSMVAGWLVIVWWVVVSLGANLAGVLGSGIFGATLDVPGGLWTICFSVALGVLAAWVAWGMWPLAQKKKK
jgi:hypothetical protein